MIIQPTGDNVIVKLEKDKNLTTASGIVLPKIPNQKEDKGVVVSIGPGRILNDGTYLNHSVKVGDIVIFNKFAGTEIENHDEKYLIIKENDILAIIKE